MMKESESKLLERSFEPCYQATVGMDFVSKLVTLEVRENQRVAVSEVVLKEICCRLGSRFDCNYGTRPVKRDFAR